MDNFADFTANWFNMTPEQLVKEEKYVLELLEDDRYAITFARACAKYAVNNIKLNSNNE